MSDICFGISPVQSGVTSFSDMFGNVASPAVGATRETTFHAWRRVRRPIAREIESREAVSVPDYTVIDISVLAGQAATADVFIAQRAKARLISLVQRFAVDGIALGGEEVKIDRETADASIALIDLLPSSAPLPRIAPDGEGGLTAVWELPNEAVVIVVAEWRLNIVTSAASPNAEYFDDLPFDGEHLPQPLIEAIASR